MSLLNFLSQTCNITEIAIVVSGGEETRTENPIYTGIPCYYYKSTAKLEDTGTSENTQLDNFKVLLEADKTLIRPNMNIQITDPDIGIIGKFLIEGVKVNRFSTGSRDSMELVIKSL